MTEKFVIRSTGGAVEQTYYSVLSRMIAATSQDRAQMRAMIYDLARVTMIRNNLYRGTKEVDWSRMQNQYRALEAAIKQVEADYTGDAGPLPSHVEKTAIGDGTDAPATHTAVMLPPRSLKTQIFDTADAPIPSSFFLSSRRFGVAHNWSSPSVFDRDDQSAYARYRKPVRRNFWWTVQLLAAGSLGRHDLYRDRRRECTIRLDEFLPAA